MKIKTLILLLLLSLIIIFLVAIRLGGSFQNGQININKAEDSKGNFSIESRSPAKPIEITDPIIVQFSEPITINASFSNLYYQLIPETELSLSLDDTGKILTVKPNPVWLIDQYYQFIISKETINNKGNSLGKDYIIEFKTQPYHGE